MKIIKGLFIGFCILFLFGGIGFYIFLKTFDFNQYKTQITKYVAEQVHKKVTIGNIDLSFSLNRGVALKVSKLDIFDEIGNARRNFLSIDAAYLSVSIKELILKRAIVVSNVDVNVMTLSITRFSDGKFNLPGSEPVSPSTPSLPETAQPVPVEVPQKSGNATVTLPKVSIRSVHVNNSKFVYEDKMVSPALNVSLNKIDFEASNFSFDQPVPIRASASFLSESKNIFAEGKMKIDSKTMEASFEDLLVNSDVSAINLSSLHALLGLKEEPLIENLKGEIHADVHSVVIGPSGLKKLTLEGDVNDGSIKFVAYPVPLENIDVRFAMNESELQIKELFMYVGAGKIIAHANLKDYLLTQGFTFDIYTEDLKLQEMVPSQLIPVNVEGKLAAQVKGAGAGLDPKHILEKLTADVSIDMKEGRIKDINLLKEIFNGLGFIPNFNEEVLPNLPPRYQERLKDTDTLLEKVNLTGNVEGSQFVIKNCELVAEGLLLKIAGNINFNQQAALSGDFYFPQDLSKIMTDSAEELASFLNENGEIHIPLKSYEGDLAHISMLPDWEALGKTFMKDKGKEEIKKVIFKALDIEETLPQEGEGTAPQGEGEPSEEQKEPSPEAVIIEKVLDSIFSD